jgi:hypothetical protein
MNLTRIGIIPEFLSAINPHKYGIILSDPWQHR